MPYLDQVEVERLRELLRDTYQLVTLVNTLDNVYRLLDVLADRKAKKGLSGHVLINGKRQSHNFKCASAYVVQVSSV